MINTIEGEDTIADEDDNIPLAELEQGHPKCSTCLYVFEGSYSYMASGDFCPVCGTEVKV